MEQLGGSVCIQVCVKRALAAAGDRSAHLLWRVQNGEGPQGVNISLIVTLIGTNDVKRMYKTFRVGEEAWASVVLAPPP